MKQSATERPDPTLFRKAAIAAGAAIDHVGKVRIKPIPNFDLDRTIFKTLEGKAARLIVTTRVAKEPHWNSAAKSAVERSYEKARTEVPLPKDVEHADGSFLDHLYFCFEYNVHHFPDQSPVVMLLHSILGTGTNTFAMTTDKIPALRELLSDSEWCHIEAFPSVLRLLYDNDGLRRELRKNQHRIDSLESISFRRVIDNEPVEMSGEELWTQLNFQLIHLIDFLPVANWALHANDTSFILFRDLYDLLETMGKLRATVGYSPAKKRTFKGEPRSALSFLTTLIPVSLSEKMATSSIKKFSERIGHSLAFQLHWAS